MKTCCSINCPFINQCKDYSNFVDKKNGCKTQKSIIDNALQLIVSKKLNERKMLPVQMETFNILTEEKDVDVNTIHTHNVKDYKNLVNGTGTCTIMFEVEYYK